MNKTTIESLPNELWMILFQYFDVSELYNQFNGLNSRIDRIIQLVNNLCLIINEANHTFYLEHIMPWIRCEHVNSLAFLDDSKKYPQTEFFLLYPLEKFTELRSFIFCGWSLPFYNPRQVIEQLPSLTHLQKLDVELHEFPQDNYEENNTRLMELIFNSSDNLRKSLRYVNMNMYIGERTLPLVTFLPANIEYFQVSVIDLEPFLKLIPSLEPRCKTIKFEYLEVNHIVEVVLPLLNVLNCCTKLTIKTNCYFQFHHLQVFLSRFPEVKQLIIDNSSADDSLTAGQLEILVQNHWSKLVKFEWIDPGFLKGFGQSEFWQKQYISCLDVGPRKLKYQLDRTEEDLDECYE